jgi:hypothetical protein
MQTLSLIVWILALAVCYWLGYRSGRVRPDTLTIQQELELCRTQRLADGIRRQGDELTQYEPADSGLVSQVREIKRN